MAKFQPGDYAKAVVRQGEQRELGLVLMVGRPSDNSQLWGLRRFARHFRGCHAFAPNPWVSCEDVIQPRLHLGKSV
jgi:hypothetical protein